MHRHSFYSRCYGKSEAVKQSEAPWRHTNEGCCNIDPVRDLELFLLSPIDIPTPARIEPFRGLVFNPTSSQTRGQALAQSAGDCGPLALDASYQFHSQH